MTFIIAEAGVNHDGNIENAIKLVDVALNAGANAVKFQTFKASELSTNRAKLADYQIETQLSDNQYEMLKKLELSFSDFRILKKYCDDKKIQFMSTAFDDFSLKFLVKEINQSIFKIPSGEITNLPFILKHARLKKRIILSTGMSTTLDIDNALRTIYCGITEENDLRKIEAVDMSSSEFQTVINKFVSILHCTSEYPTPFSEINLRSINFLKDRYNLCVGLSDHSDGIEVSIAAVAMGAEIIEKHFTLNKNAVGPDHRASLNPQELTDMIKKIRNIELAQGDYGKSIQASELKNIIAVRKSLVANGNIKTGELFTPENISSKRPFDGMSPSLAFKLYGLPSSKNYNKDELIDEEL
jgi:N-acetylneuraminate synthase